MSRKAIAFIVVPILLVSAFLFSNFLASKKELPPQRPVPEPVNYVKVTPVEYRTLPVEIEVFGRVGSSQQVNLVAEVGGKLEKGEINLKEGEKFRKGQVLAQINRREQSLNLQARKSNFLNLLANVIPDVKIDYPEEYSEWQRYFDSIDLEKNLPTLPASMSSKLQTLLASRSVLNEYYTIKSLEENLKKYTLVAPYTGSILSVNLEISSVVNPGAAIATLIRTDRLELKVPIQQEDIEFVEVGTEVTVLQEDQNKEWKGRIIRKANFIDPNSQSVNIYIDIENAQSDVYDGLYLKAVIPGKYVDQGMIIDRSIIRNKSEVYVVQDSLLQTHQVKIEKIDGNEVIISGLEDGLLLAVDVPSNAVNNMKVEISNN